MYSHYIYNIYNKLRRSGVIEQAPHYGAIEHGKRAARMSVLVGKWWVTTCQHQR
jgi:hypothetical protein